MNLGNSEIIDRVKRGQCALTRHQDDVVLKPLKPVSEVAGGDNKNKEHTHQERR